MCVCVWVAGAGRGGRFFQLLVFLFISFQPGLTWGALTDTDIYVNGNQNSGCLCEERRGGARIDSEKIRKNLVNSSKLTTKINTEDLCISL